MLNEKRCGGSITPNISATGLHLQNHSYPLRYPPQLLLPSAAFCAGKFTKLALLLHLCTAPCGATSPLGPWQLLGYGHSGPTLPVGLPNTGPCVLLRAYRRSSRVGVCAGQARVALGWRGNADRRLILLPHRCPRRGAAARACEARATNLPLNPTILPASNPRIRPHPAFGRL